MLERTRRPSRTEVSEEDQVGDKRLQQGRRTTRGLSAGGSEKVDKDESRELYESGRGKVDPKYRRHVEEYFRAISESSEVGESVPTTAPSE